MRARSRSFLVVAVAVVLFGSAADLLASAATMACCEKTDFTCAGMRTPDDCCRSMKHAGRNDFAATRSVPAMDAHHAAVLPDRPGVDPIVVDEAFVKAFKRPHDPPHLHAFNLLI